ncbi:beta-hexosaminidase [Xylariaceae sp. FL0804]|nr:beta-hexosaminidase [Xylariaceae sp. FL0804]
MWLLRAHMCLLVAVTLTNVSARLLGIPTVPYTQSGDGSYSVSSLKSLTVDSAYANSRDERGETLIPPTLHDFATTFADDLQTILNINLSVSVGHKASPDSIFLTLTNPSKYTSASGAPSSEGYTLSVSSSGITISGASPLGAWWGTRTVLQQSVLLDGALPYGEGDDTPGWGIRGIMLDAGRHYYPPEFIIEMCSYMSFFKQNLFHLHLSDNLYNNVDIYSTEQSLDLYARFRLWSDAAEVAGLNTHKNESYTKDQFEEIQQSCASRGVTILPEIEAPGHALPIVQWKPELGLSSDLSLLNISHPDTIPTMKTIWGTFLDWFHCKTVHIGADEYTGPVDDYNMFVEEMDSFIYETSGKSIRIWGTFPPEPEYDNISTNVSIQHWEYFEDNPLFDYILNNYSVLNSDDTYYVVNKWSGSYPQVVPISKTFNGNPADNGIWQPYIFDTKNSTNNPEKTSPLVSGAVTPIWNDYGANTSVYSEAYYALKTGIPALGDKQWGGDLSASEFPPALSALQASIPGQNLDRSIPSKTSTIVSYRVNSKQCRGHLSMNEARGEKKVADQSGNGYDASTDCPFASADTLAVSPSCSFKTPLLSKGRNYTLSLRIRVDEIHGDGGDDATIIAGADSALMLTPNITLSASGNYYRLNSTVPAGSWVDLSIVGRGNQTFARVRETVGLDDPLPQPGSSTAPEEEEEEFLATLGINGEYLVWTPEAVEAPVAVIGGAGSAWSGEFAAMSLSSEA